MEDPDKLLHRLARAARGEELLPPGELPPWMATRVLAGLRRRHSTDGYWWEPWARGTAAAAATFALIAWLGRPELPPFPENPADLATSFILSELEP